MACDQVFGPRVDVSCRAFDFTLYFEDAILGCLPTAALLLLLFPLLAVLIRRPLAVQGPRLLTAKLITYTCLLVCQTIFLALRSVNPVIKTRASVASDAIGLVGVIGAGLLSWFDHRRSIRPSTVLALYLSIVTLLDLARLRTLWSIPGVTGEASVFTLAFVLKCVALTMESISKQCSLQSASDYLGVGSEPFSGLWTRTTYVWLLGTVRQGYRHILSVDDLPGIEPKLRSHVLHEQLEKEWAASDRTKKNGLLLTCFRTYSISFLSAVLPRLCLSGFTFAQPFMISTFTTWIQDKDAPDSSGKAMIGAYALVYVGMATSTAIYWYQSYRFLIRLRGGLIALVYRRTVETRAVDLGEITGLTLMGTDVERILVGFRSIHEVWASLLEMIISLYLLERQLQVACLLPGVLTLVFSLTTFKLSSWGNDAQKKWIERVEERLSVTSSMLGDMKAVKMLGLTDRMFEIIDRLQRIEVETSKRFRKILIAQVFFSNSPAALAPVATFAFYVGISRAQGNESILASRAFTSLALISLLTASALTFIQSIPSMVQCFACFGRIQEFCHDPSGPSECPDVKSAAFVNAGDPTNIEMHDVKKIPEREQSSVLVSFTNQSFAWKAGGEPCLKSLNFDIHARKVTAIIGPTASGKSTLMHSIVRETCALEGQTIRRFETAAYCSQVPWLTNDTIRSNIIGALAMEELWYASVLHACALEEDISGMARGDQTKVGNNGAGLSGGQRQRVTLARALYSRCKVVLLDDTFSGLDAHTVEVIAGRVFGPRGLFARNQVSVIVATHSAAILPFADDIIVLQDGTVTKTGSAQSLAQSLEDLPISTLTQTGTSEGASAEPSAEQVETEKLSAEQDAIDALDPKRQQGDWSVYSYYFKAAGRREVVFFLLFMILWTVCEQFSSIWLNWWSNANEIEPHAREGMYLGVYAALGVAASAFMSAACWILFVDMITKSMRSLHRGLLITTLHAPLYFFHKTDIGSITNRFSQDMELIGLDFPLVAVNYVSAACNCVAQVLILGIYTKYLAVTVPFVLILVILIQRFYLRTSRQIRLLDIEAKAPVFSHFIETNTGAATIRAFGWQTYFGQRLVSVLDRSQRPVYLLLSVQRWLAVLLDLIVSILAILLVSIIVRWKSAFDPGAVGLSLVLVMTFNKTLMSVVRFWTMLETSIGAVARVQKYVNDTVSETREDASPKPVPRDWPASGAIRFTDLAVSHMPDGPPVLKNLSLDIKAGERIAICGRSGSGKSSLILSLLRMTMLQDGLIEVDGVDVSSVPLVELRQRINVVPQDPAPMPGTVRFNLDPYFSATDHDIVRVLERLQLWERIERAGGLDAQFENASWSVGERQLLCLARAMVRKSKVLVLDEATSSVDQQTESLMQDAIKTWFSDCTVLSVMHRLDAIRSFDKVAVLHDGVVAEFGSPDQLLEADSRLQAFYRAGGYYN